MELHYISSNSKKLEEMRCFFGDAIKSISLDIMEIQGDADAIIRHKILEAYKMTGLNRIIVDDASLYIDGLYGFPGPYFKDFLQLGNNKMVDIALKTGNRYKIICKVGLYLDGQVHIFTGEGRGVIKENPEVKDTNYYGILYPDNCFDVPYSNLSEEQMLRVSARVQAARKLKEFIETKDK